MLPTALIAGLLAAAPAAEPSPTVITLLERAPLAFVLNTPSGEQGRLRVSEILAALAEPLEQRTDLALAPLEPTAIDECEGGLVCLSRRVPRGAGLLLVLSYFAAAPGRPDRVSALLVDVASAEACATDPFGQDRVDACVSERAVRVRPPPANLSDASEARGVLARLVQENLRDAFEATGHWAPHGEILVRGLPAGAALLVDEQTVGVAPGGPVLLAGVGAGARRVGYSVSGVVQGGERVEVARGVRAQLTFTREAEGDGFATPLFWSGVGVAALGAGLGAWSLAYASQQSDMVAYCDAATCRSSFFTLEQQARGPVENLMGPPNEGSVLALPLGYSLLITGATWAAGAKLVRDDPVLHWVLVGAGIAAGGLAYGISAAANGP